MVLVAAEPKFRVAGYFSMCIKAEGLNIINAAIADRQVVMEMSSRIFWRVDPPLHPFSQQSVCVALGRNTCTPGYFSISFYLI